MRIPPHQPRSQHVADAFQMLREVMENRVRRVVTVSAWLVGSVEEAVRRYCTIDGIKMVNPLALLRIQSRGMLLPSELPELSSE
jgi:hypothetical protein